MTTPTEHPTRTAESQAESQEVRREPAAASTSAAPARPRRSLGRHPYRLFFAFALLAGAVVFLVVEGLGSSLNYYVTVNQAIVRKAQIGTSTIRLQGSVVRGSIVHTAKGANFEVVNGGDRVPVREVGEPPQLFQPGIPVVVVGHFASGGSDLFMSNQIMVKHTPNYVAKQRQGSRAANGAA